MLRTLGAAERSARVRAAVPDILANDSIEELENLLSSRAAGEHRTAADVMFADLVSAHQIPTWSWPRVASTP